MPLFGNKFSPKKGQPRKWPSLSNINMDRNERAAEFGLDYGPIKLKLDGNEISFDQGQWVAESEGETSNQREVQKLRRAKQQLEEENNLLKLKVEILLDMLAQTTAESHLQENEIENLKKMAARKR